MNHAQDNLPHCGMLPKKHRQGAVIQAAQGKCIAVELPVQSAVTHEVDRCLEHIHGVLLSGAYGSRKPMDLSLPAASPLKPLPSRS